MYPRQRIRRGHVGSGGGGGGGGTALARIAGPAANVDWPYPTCYSMLFTNLMKQHGNYLRSDNLYSNGEDATTGWPLNITAGSNILFFIVTMVGQSPSYIRPGVYEARISSAMASAGWTCQFVDGGGVNISSISAAGSTCTATINDLTTTGDYVGTVLNLRLTAPGSAGPWNLSPNDSTAIECYLQANKTRLNSFNSNPVTNEVDMFDPDVITDLSAMKLIRTKDLAGTDIVFLNAPQFSSGDVITCKTGITSYAHCRQEAFRTWQMPTSATFARDKADGKDYQLGGQVPYSVQAKLAKHTSNAIFISLPSMINVTPYDVDATTDILTCHGHSINNGDPCVLGTYTGGFNNNYLPIVAGTPLAMWTVYYARDVVPAVSLRLSRTPGGAAIDFTVTSADGGAFQQNIGRLYSHAEYMALYTSIANEMFAAAPGIDIVLDVCNENWNTAPQYGFHPMVDVIAGNVPSAPSAGAAYAWCQMRAWAAFESVYPRSQIVRMISGQHYFFGSIMNQAYPYTDPTLYVGQTIAQLIDAHCCAVYLYVSMTGKALPASDGGSVVAPYLAGSTWQSAATYNVGEYVHMNDGTNYRCILQHTNQVPPNATYWVVDSTNILVGSCASWNPSQLNLYVKLSAQMGQIYQSLYKSQADAYTSPRSVGYITYEGGITYLGQSSSFAFSGMTTFAGVFQTWFNSSSAPQALTDFLTYANTNAGIKTSTYYIGAGQWRKNSNTDCVTFGIKRSHHIPDNAGMAYWKTATF